jgi:hypothetical protein
MIPKSGYRFSEKVMLEQKAKAKWRFNLKTFRFGHHWEGIMRTILPRTRCAFSALISIMLMGLSAAARAEDVPSYMAPIGGRTTSSAASIATRDMLALNARMFELYGDAGAVFRRNLMAKHPIILGLFSGAGGRFILYRPGMEPLDAPPVPIAYQLMKSVGHSTMALAEVVMPYLDNAADTSWRASLLSYRSQTQSALNGIGATKYRRIGRITASSFCRTTSPSWMSVPRTASLRWRRSRISPRNRRPSCGRTSLGRRRPRSDIGWA